MRKIITRTPFKLLREVNNDGTQRYLAFFIYLKKLHSNSCLFKYTHDSLSIKTGYSKSKIRKYVTFFLKNGWCRYHGKNLVLNKFQDFADCSYTIKLHTLHSEKDILDHILIQPLITKQKQCAFVYKVRKDIILSETKKWLTRSEYRNVTHNHKKVKNFSGAISESFDISIQSIAKLYNRSTGYITALLKRFERRGLLMIKRNKKVVMRCCKEVFKKMKENLDYTYYSKGYVIKVSPSSLVILKGGERLIR